MKFYCVISGSEDKKLDVYKLLEKACLERGIEMVSINSATIDLTNLPKLGVSDMLYRIGTDDQSSNVMANLLTADVTTFYIDNLKGSVSYGAGGWSHTLVHKMLGLPIIPTITSLSLDHETLAGYVKHLGGYPIVLKVQGGSHGVGVIRVDSSESLMSLSDYLLGMTSARVAMRKYIDYSAHARLIVINDRIVDSIEYKRARGDFRSNIGNKPTVAARKFSPAIERTAISATRAKGYEFGGVDILVAKDGKTFYIAEVNHPCNFARCQNLTGVDIAGQMIDHLVAKVKSRQLSKGTK